VRQPERDWTGQNLYGKWTVERRIGVGGTSTVLQARHRNGRLAALKLLHPHLASQEHTRQRFLREGRLANLVRHPGVVAVLDDFTTEEGAAVLVLELVQGQTLAALAKEAGGVLDPPDVVAAACAVLDILAVAHDANVIHRDIKPENVLLSTEGAYKLADFGLAALGHELGMLTGTNAALGTPAYMAPEQARGDSLHIDARTDIWGLGATMFTLLTGRYLYASSAPKNLVVAAATEPVPPIASMAPDMHPPLAMFIERAVQANKEERWPNARAMLAELEAIEVPANTPGRMRSGEVGAAGATTTAPSSLAPSRNAGTPSNRNSGRRRWTVAAFLGATVVGAALLSPPSPTTRDSVDSLGTNGPRREPLVATSGSLTVEPPRPAPDPVVAPPPSSAVPAPSIPAKVPRSSRKARELPSAPAAPSELAPLRSPPPGEDLSVPDDVLDRRN
jgi:serine/threonine-protein kinase